MKIIRDGKEIALTSEELVLAFREQEHIYDIQYIGNTLELSYIDTEDEDEAQIANDLLYDDDALDAIATKMRELIIEFDFGDDDAAHTAITDAIKKRLSA